MNAKEHKAKRIQKVELSSGMTVMVRRVQPKHFLAAGNVPDVLFDQKTTNETRKATMADRKVMDALFKAAFLHGCVATEDFIPVDKEKTEPDTNEVCMNDLDDMDLGLIFSAAIGGAVPPTRFQDQSQEQGAGA